MQKWDYIFVTTPVNLFGKTIVYNPNGKSFSPGGPGLQEAIKALNVAGKSGWEMVSGSQVGNIMVWTLKLPCD